MSFSNLFIEEESQHAPSNISFSQHSISSSGGKGLKSFDFSEMMGTKSENMPIMESKIYQKNTDDVLLLFKTEDSHEICG